MTAIARSEEQLRQLRQKMTDKWSDGLGKYNPRAKVPLLEDKILLDTYEVERELATKVRRKISRTYRVFLLVEWIGSRLYTLR